MPPHKNLQLRVEVFLDSTEYNSLLQLELLFYRSYGGVDRYMAKHLRDTISQVHWEKLNRYAVLIVSNLCSLIHTGDFENIPRNVQAETFRQHLIPADIIILSNDHML